MIKLITEIESAYPLMKQLRPHISLEQFLNIYTQAHSSNGYTIFGFFSVGYEPEPSDQSKTTGRLDHGKTIAHVDQSLSETTTRNRIKGLIGIRTLHDYVHGKHLYIDDLVVDENCRSQGVGKKLLDFAEDLARKSECTGLRLCTGVDNKDGMRFYERENWKQRAVVFKKKF